MKKYFCVILIALIATATYAQSPVEQQLYSCVAKLKNANNVKNYQQLVNDFVGIAKQQQTSWLPWYYAALCNVRIAWLYRRDGEMIEPFVRKADAQAKKALSLLDTTTQKKELSEVYCVLSMVYRANVFINPIVKGRQFGPAASNYIKLARRMNPDNPRATYLEASEKYYTPRIWGGDKKEAKELLELTVKQLRTDATSASYPHWGKKEVNEMLSKM